MHSEMRQQPPEKKPSFAGRGACDVVSRVDGGNQQDPYNANAKFRSFNDSIVNAGGAQPTSGLMPGIGMSPANTRNTSAARTVAPAPTQDFGGGMNAMSAPAPAPAPVMTDAEYLQGDSQYQLQLQALARALGDQGADNTAQQTRYNTDYSGAIKNLGYTQDDPTTPQDEGAWNFQDQNTASGRAFQNQQNDFAGRGMLQSTAYGTANDNLPRSLNDQLTATNTAKDSFLADLARQQGVFTADNTNQMQQAKIEALTRRGSGVSLV